MLTDLFDLLFSTAMNQHSMPPVMCFRLRAFGAILLAAATLALSSCQSDPPPSGDSDSGAHHVSARSGYHKLGMGI